MFENKIICTICARGGSKGLKNKNLKKINHKPLIFYTINQARKSRLFDKIVCTSDSNKILEEAKRNGVDLAIKRPKKYAKDNSPKLHAIKHAVDFTEKHFNYNFEYIVDLDVSAPLRSVTDIVKSLRLIKNKNYPCNLISITPSKKNPYYNMVEINKKGNIKIAKKIKKNIYGRQSAPKTYDINAGYYIWNKKGLSKLKDILNKRTIYYITPNKRSIDIDSLLDFHIVKNLLGKKI